ncbi:IAA-amino acid hydrolase ILR1, partial [Hondaea fermentalgiana]
RVDGEHEGDAEEGDLGVGGGVLGGLEHQAPPGPGRRERSLAAERQEEAASTHAGRGCERERERERERVGRRASEVLPAGEGDEELDGEMAEAVADPVARAGGGVEWEDVRKDLHMHPELGLEEERTSKLVVKKLQSFGMDQIRTGIGGTGVVGTLKGTQRSSEGDPAALREIGFRADMDCLPMQEANDFGHKSRTPGRFHGCGHDGHTTMVLAAAEHLAKRRDTFAGTVHFIFQPAEENFGGARLMIEDGLLVEHTRCDEIYGVHNWPYPEVPPGFFAVRSGPIMASADEFEIIIKGEGGHAAMPHLTVDPITIGAQLVSALQTVVSRGNDPLQPVVLSITRFNAGSAFNVIPNTAVLCGTVRAFREDDRSRVQAQLERMSQSVCMASNATATVNYYRGYPPTVNSKKQAEYARQAAELAFGVDNVLLDCDPSLAAEDFSYMLDQVGGAYAWVGADSPGKLHETNFDFDDSIIPVTVQYYVNLVNLRLAAKTASGASASAADEATV